MFLVVLPENPTLLGPSPQPLTPALFSGQNSLVFPPYYKMDFVHYGFTDVLCFLCIPHLFL